MKRNAHEEVTGTNSPGFFAKEKRLKDSEAKSALSKSARGLKARQEKVAREDDEAAMASYKLNRKDKF